MPRPTTKEQLLTSAQKEHDALDAILETLSSLDLDVTSADIEQWGVKDILAHVTEWEQMCLGWYRAGVAGKNPPLPAEGFNWREIPALNLQIYQKHRQRSWREVLNAYRSSYQEILKTLQDIDEEEMFTPARYAWTRKNAMGTYFVSATSSHYVWATKEIRKYLREQNSVQTSMAEAQSYQ